MQGTQTVYLVHFPRFYEAKHRRQLIMSIDLPSSVKQDYAAIKKTSPEEALSFVLADKVVLSDLVKQGGNLFGSIKSDAS